MEDSSRSKSLLKAGDLVLLLDRRQKRYLLTLTPGAAFHTHVGILTHDDMIGQEEGCRLKSTQGATFLVLRPRLADFVENVPRITQVIYPKDLGAILLLADIYPGAVVVEGGMGSGMLTIALLRAVGKEGQVVSYEARPEMAQKALKHVQQMFGDAPHLQVRIQDLYQGIQERDVDRIVLDVPEPWQVVSSAAQALRPGGILLSFLPTVLQIHHLVEALHQEPLFDLVDTVELSLRPWYVTPRSVRPVHRMVAHTGFITTARRCAPKPSPPTPMEEGTGY